MYRVMVKVICVDDTYDHEYSGIYHSNREDAEKERLEAELYLANDITIDCVYVEEY